MPNANNASILVAETFMKMIKFLVSTLLAGILQQRTTPKIGVTNTLIWYDHCFAALRGHQ
jgi:hypothetical protein